MGIKSKIAEALDQLKPSLEKSVFRNVDEILKGKETVRNVIAGEAVRVGLNGLTNLADNGNKAAFSDLQGLARLAENMGLADIYDLAVFAELSDPNDKTGFSECLIERFELIFENGA